MEINGDEIGYNKPCYIIAEAGINHNGDYDIAEELVDIAVRSGANAVKFQTFKETELPFKNLTYDEFIQIKRYCDSQKITFLSTPHSLSAIDFLTPLVPAFKIASPFITNDYFVKRVKVKGKPIIASMGSVKNDTGIATEDEIKHFLRLANTNLAILYCISKYPCYTFNPQAFSDFIDSYNNYPVGFSCHHPGIEYSLEAFKQGACIIEKHITIDKTFKCPDKNVSIDEELLTKLISKIRDMEDEYYSTLANDI